MLKNRTPTTRLALLATALTIGALTYSSAAHAQYRRQWGHPGWYQRWPGYGTCWNCGFLPGVAVGVGVGALATAPYAYAPYSYPPPVYYGAPAYYVAPYGWDNLYPETEPGYVLPGSG